MTLDGFRELVLRCDPAATHYEGTGKGNCTVWQEIRRLNYAADGRKLGGWDCQIDRWTKAENDAIAQKIEEELDKSDELCFKHIVSYDVETGYIRHIFSCEVA